MHAERIYDLFRYPLSWFDFKKGSAERGGITTPLKNHVILVGVHRLGGNIAERFVKQKQNFLIVDFNPEVTDHFAQAGIPAICGDIADPYIQELAGLDRAKLIISTLPQLHDNLAILESIKKQGLRIRTIITGQNEQDAVTLYKNNVDYVLLPHYVGSQHLSKILEEKNTFSRLSRLRQTHLKTLQDK